MPLVEDALGQVLQKYAYNAGMFYGSADGLDLGAGLIYRNVVHPSYNDETQKYDTRAGAAFILTHECDVDPANSRHFNDEVAVIPIIMFDQFCEWFAREESPGALFAFIDNLAKDVVSRVMYLPPVPRHITDFMPTGGLIYLNNVCSSPTALFGEGAVTPVCALSSYALQFFDMKLENHFRRPKAQALPRLR